MVADQIWLGGVPILPAEIDWPIYVHPTQPECAAPMHFMGQIDLAQVLALPERPALPDHWTLFFFFDPIFAPFDDVPANAGLVIYVEDDVSDIAARPMPELPVVNEEDGAGCKKGWTVRAASHVPLLTLSSDGEMGFLHGESQSIVFWISPEDLENRNFENVYLADRAG